MSMTTIDERFDRMARQLTEQLTDLRLEVSRLYRWTIVSIFVALSLGLAAGRLLG
jgi:hypothetical protein